MDEIIENVRKLIYFYKAGLLGGEIMPEDENPHLAKEVWKTIYILRYLWH